MKRLGNHSTRPTETASTSSSKNGVAAKRRMVLTRRVDKWIAENDRTLSTTTWLTYERLNRECVQCLKCSVCIRFRDKLVNSTRLIKSFECPIKNYFERTLCQSSISTLTAGLHFTDLLFLHFLLPSLTFPPSLPQFHLTTSYSSHNNPLLPHLLPLLFYQQMFQVSVYPPLLSASHQLFLFEAL